MIDPAASVSVATDTDYTLDTHPGPEDYLFVKQTGAYRFSLDVSTPSAPVLRVVRVAAAPVAAIDPHQDHQPRGALAYPTWDGKQETARFSVKDAGAPLREYAQSTTMQLRDPGTAVRHATRNRPTCRRVRSGNLAFDALFALAGAEMKQDSVARNQGRQLQRRRRRLPATASRPARNGITSGRATCRTRPTWAWPCSTRCA